MSKKKKVPLFSINFNEVIYQPNGIVIVPFLALIFTIHPIDKTWTIRINAVFFQIDIGWVHDETQDT